MAAATVNDEQAWQDGEFTFNVDPEADGSYAIESEDPFYFVSGSTVADPDITPADVTVLFYEDNGTTNASNKKLDSDDRLVSAADTIENRIGGTPKTSGKTYFAVIFQGDVVDSATGKLYDPTTTDAFSVADAYNSINDYVVLTVGPKTTELANVSAYQYDTNADKNGMADETFNYTGAALNVAFKMGDTALVDGTNYTVKWTSVPEGAAEPTKYASGCYTVVDAGTYTAELTGTGTGDPAYSGKATVSFTVEGVDLSADAVTVGPFDKTAGITFGTNQTGSDGLDLTGILVNSQIVANGVSLDAFAELTATLIAVNDVAVGSDDRATYTGTYKTAGKYTFRIQANDGSKNVTGSTTVDAYVVDNAVKYYYNADSGYTAGQLVANKDFGPFNEAKGTVYSPTALEAVYGASNTEAEFTSVVTKDGVETTDYTQPGEYVLTLDTPVKTASDGTTYAGHLVTKFTVAGADYSDAVIYVSWDGKNVADGADFDYTGEAIAPTVTVKLGKETLVQGEDYTVAMTDASGVAVESAVEPGDYILAFEFAGTEPTGFSGEFDFTINKAKIESAEPAADFFATDGETAASPAFVGSNSADFDRGLKFDLAAEDIDVVYYKGEFAKDTDGDSKADAWEASTTRVAAEDLTEEGVYFANIQVKSTAAFIQNGDSPLSVQFTVSKTVVFHDVDANAWYAGSVYDAALLGYMDGVAQGIFAPERAMTRAEFAQVVYNMATNGTGGTTANGTTYPTKYTDVPADAWYAKAIEWASRYGIVNGTSETTFEPNGTVTREQIATMLYRYAGNGAQADASALDAFVDGAQVSGWAENAMAWAVEEGHMNGKGANDLQPQATATRAEIATLAVRVQPEWL